MQLQSLSFILSLAAGVVLAGPITQLYSNTDADNPAHSPSRPGFHYTSVPPRSSSHSFKLTPGLVFSPPSLRFLAQGNPPSSPPSNLQPNPKPNPQTNPNPNIIPTPSSDDSPFDNRPFWSDPDDGQPKKPSRYRDYHICAAAAVDRDVCRSCLRNLQRVQDELGWRRNWDSVVGYCIVDSKACEIAPQKGTANCAPGTEVGVYRLMESFWDAHRNL